MDKFKNVAKGGWHPSSDRPIHRASWKSDIKGIATGKKKDPYEYAREHQSAPLSTLKDPDSFGPPPKHTGAHGSQPGTSTSTSPPPTGLGAPVPRPAPRAPPRDAQDDEEASRAPPEPYRTNTTGLRTDNLPKPPLRRIDAAQTGGNSESTASPSLPPRQPPRQPQPQARPPILPPRQNEYPDEFTPAPPPSYSEAAAASAPDPAAINQAAASRLARAGVSVPGLDIGSSANTTSQPSPVRGPQLGELQARFARMNTGASSQAASNAPVSAMAAAASQKKVPPAPPPKKANLTGLATDQQGSASSPTTTSNSAFDAPPVPLGSKPRPT